MAKVRLNAAPLPTSPLKVGGVVFAITSLESPPTFRGEGWVGGAAAGCRERNPA
jgi:hypothetical protein